MGQVKVKLYILGVSLVLVWRLQRVGIRGHGEGQWLIWILEQAPHEGSVDEHATQLCNKAKHLLWKK
jgi:hypothetical protein